MIYIITHTFNINLTFVIVYADLKWLLKIRSIVMFGAVTFHSFLTIQLSQKLELQKKRSLAKILGNQYGSYRQALALTNLSRLDHLREDACLPWALKAQNNGKHSDLFPINQSSTNTCFRHKYEEYFCRTAKYYNSAVPSMTRALHKHNKNWT